MKTYFIFLNFIFYKNNLLYFYFILLLKKYISFLFKHSILDFIKKRSALKDVRMSQNFNYAIRRGHRFCRYDACERLIQSSPQFWRTLPAIMARKLSWGSSEGTDGTFQLTESLIRLKMVTTLRRGMYIPSQSFRIIKNWTGIVFLSVS